VHLKVPNHGRLFKVLMTVHVANWRLHVGTMAQSVAYI
jgi:hypothetical protein